MPAYQSFINSSIKNKILDDYRAHLMEKKEKERKK
jgi:hypothetical protein